ncbi:MAG: hypothetical protein ACFFCF_07610 [Promethearchaeota archaeon]
MEKKKIPLRMVGALLRPRNIFQEIAEHLDLIGAVAAIISFYLVNAIVFVVSSTTYFTLLGRYGVWIQIMLNRTILERTIIGLFLLLGGWSLISQLFKVAYDLPSWKKIASPLGYAFMGGMIIVAIEALTIPFHPHITLPGPEEFQLYEQFMSNQPIMQQWLLISLAFRFAINLVISILGSFGFNAFKGTLSQAQLFLRIFVCLTTFSFIHVLFFLPIEYIVVLAIAD